MSICLRAFASMLLIVSLIQVVQPNGLYGQEATEKYVDSKFDFSITVSQPWKPARLQDYAVPGVIRTAFSGADAASIVLFVQEPGKAFEPRFLVDESAKSIATQLGATVNEKNVRAVAQKQAMWLIVEGDGNGGAIDGKGPMKTTQFWVAIPREKDIIVALLTSPASAFAENRKSFEAALKTFVVGGTQTDAQQKSD